jgi:hypothetical protein
MYSSSGLLEERPSNTGEPLDLNKNIHHFKQHISSFLFFVGHFCIHGYGFAFPMRIRI